MKPLITRYCRGRMTGVIMLALLVFALSGCGNDKAAILGKWEQTDCELRSVGLPMTGAGWYEVEFLKGDTVILKNNGSWTYSFPQAGYLNIGGNMGETFEYELEKGILRLRQGDEYCDYQRLGSATSQGAGTSTLLWVPLILLATGAAGVYFIRRRGKPQGAPPAGDAAPARPVAQAFCMHCGQPVQAGSKFCLHCGKPLS